MRVIHVPMVVDDPDPTGSCEQPGTIDAFSEFYEAQYPSVLRLAAALVGRWEVAEELVQESFMALHARWRAFLNTNRRRCGCGGW